jgi:hypothetical protein
MPKVHGKAAIGMKSRERVRILMITGIFTPAPRNHSKQDSIRRKK